MAAGKRGGRGIKGRNISASAGIRPFAMDNNYASNAEFLADKAASGEHLAVAEIGDSYFNTTSRQLLIATQAGLPSSTAITFEPVGVVSATSANTVNFLDNQPVGSPRTQTSWAVVADNDEVLIQSGSASFVAVRYGVTGIVEPRPVPGNGGMFIQGGTGIGQGLIISRSIFVHPQLTRANAYQIGTTGFFYELTFFLQSLPIIADYSVVAFGIAQNGGNAQHISSPAVFSGFNGGVGDLLFVNCQNGQYRSETRLSGFPSISTVLGPVAAGGVFQTVRINVDINGAATYLVNGVTPPGAIPYSFGAGMGAFVSPVLQLSRSGFTSLNGPVVTAWSWGTL